jgi:hypothetical protein
LGGEEQEEKVGTAEEEEEEDTHLVRGHGTTIHVARYGSPYTPGVPNPLSDEKRNTAL